MVVLQVSRLDADKPFILPTQAYANDAGLDLYCSQRTVIAARAFAQLHTNVAVAIPVGYWGLLGGRSSTFMRLNLIVNDGRIDSGYRGEIMGLVYNASGKAVLVKPGDKLLQLVILPHIEVKLHSTVVLPSSVRGTRGIGSTGS